MIHVSAAYDLAGLVFAAVAVASALARGERKRWANAGFWGLLAVSFLFGDRLGNLGNGVLVLGLALIGGLVGLGPAPAMSSVGVGEGARRLGGRVFLPLLIIPLVTLVGTVTLGLIRPGGAPLVDPKQVTVISLALGIVIALGVAMIMTRPPLTAPVREARRLLQSVGAAAILPQLLAALGAVFVLAGVGPAVQSLLGAWIPLDNRLAVIIAYCLGMALFTMVVGNAFAAFPIMVAGLGAPLIVGRFGGDAAIMGALGMLSGFCGTLMTPMASHNIIPTALLDLPPWAVIRVQAPTALAILAVNVTLLALLVFHGR
jgi:uncharacterized membrane protein